jgi:hypothetical protein
MEKFIKIDNTYYRESALEQIEEKEETLILRVRVDGKLKEFEIRGQKKASFPDFVERQLFLMGGKFASSREEKRELNNIASANTPKIHMNMGIADMMVKVKFET